MTQKTVKDYYAVLGVSQHASLEEIRLAYRRSARAFHPDLSTDPDAEARFREVNEAYEVLANAEKRRAYDYFTAGTGAEGDGVVGPEPVRPPLSPVVEPAPTWNVGRPDEASRVNVTTSLSRDALGRKRFYPPTWVILIIILGGCTIVAIAVGSLLSLQRNRPTGGAEAAGVTNS